MTLVIHRLHDLDLLIKARGTDFKVSIDHLDDAQNAEIQNQLARIYRYCGCKEATIGLLIGAVLSSVVTLVLEAGWSALPLALLAAVACSGLAKVTAQWRARRRLGRTIAALKQLFHG